MFWTEINDDPNHEFCGKNCFYSAEEAIEDMGHQTSNGDQAYHTALTSYLQARDALKQARVARGFYPVVVPAGFVPGPKGKGTRHRKRERQEQGYVTVERERQRQ